MMLGALLMLAAPTAPPLWTQNHTSQVKSFASRMVDASGSGSGSSSTPLVATGSQFTSDQDVSALHARTGEAFWSSTAMDEWTYGVALQPRLPADPSRPSVGLVAFGCPFAPSGIPPPCVLGFWKDATKGKLAWKAPLLGSALNPGVGPPTVFFSADGKQIIALYSRAASSPSLPPIELLAVVSTADGTLIATQELGAGSGHGVQVQQPDPLAPPPPVTNALISLPGSSSENSSGAENVLFSRCHFILKNDHFTKTGSGQTWESC
jgi:outer membrane protein assembly factor BamB